MNTRRTRLTGVTLAAFVLGGLYCPLLFVAIGALSQFSRAFTLAMLPPFLLAAGFLLRRYLWTPAPPRLRSHLAIGIEATSWIVVATFLFFVTDINLMTPFERIGATGAALLVASALWLPVVLVRRPISSGGSRRYRPRVPPLQCSWSLPRRWRRPSRICAFRPLPLADTIALRSRPVDCRSPGEATRRNCVPWERALRTLDIALVHEGRLDRLLLGVRLFGGGLRVGWLRLDDARLERWAPSGRARPRRPRGMPGTAASSSTVASRTRRTLPKWRSSWRWRPGPMPGMSASAERRVRRRRWLRWKVMAKRCASSRSCCRTNISALFGANRDRVLRLRQEHAIGLASLRRPALRLAGAWTGLGGRRRGPARRRRRRRRRPGGSAGAAGDRARPRRRRATALARRPPSSSATSRSLASATIGSPTPGRTSMPTSRAAARAIASWPLPPSTTMRSGSFQALSASLPRASVGLAGAAEPPREHLVHRGEVVVLARVARPRRGRGPCTCGSGVFSGRPSTNTTIEATVAKPWRCETS